jgi:transcriptional regulator with XRE-family HTH domain
MSPQGPSLRELGEFIRGQRNSARISLRGLANLAGVSSPYLSQIERGMRKPSAEILKQIANALRISAETLYVRAGILDDNSTQDLAKEILESKELSEEQKQIMIKLYLTFKTLNKQAPVK